MSEVELPELVVQSQKHRVLHLLAYVREYSTLSTYSDTVFLFREKMVDYMVTPNKKVHFNGLSQPRILKSKSYYRFTDYLGLDSVSNECNHHFSWSDWIGIPVDCKIPVRLQRVALATDTIRGKYSPTEIWLKNNDRITVDVNVLADTASRKWVPELSGFFRNNLDFENFRMRFNYDNVLDNSISPMNLTGYSFNIESNGRGRRMFRLGRAEAPCFVSTYTEVYIIDKEYITVKEAKQWEKRKFDADKIDIYEPPEAPALQPSVQELVARVDAVDHNKARLSVVPDKRLAGRHVVRQTVGQRVLSLFKSLTGISSIKAKKNRERKWKEFKQEQIQRNNSLPEK